MNNIDKGKLVFPCQFTYKIIGRANKEFEHAVRKILRQHFPQLDDASISYNISKNGKYLAFTVHVIALNQAQLDAAYQDLSDDPLVLFAL
jgi:putative lipoic acid-binding regulatory protein